MKEKRNIATLLAVVGTGLLMAQSALAILTIDPTAQTLEWTSMGPATYRVRQRTDLTSGGWTDNPSFVASPGKNSWSITIASQQFYRLQIETSPGVFSDLYDIVGYVKRSYPLDIICPQFLSNNPNKIMMDDVFSGMSDQCVMNTWILNSTYVEYKYYAIPDRWYDVNFNTPLVLLDLGKAVWFIDPGPNYTIIMSGKAPSAPSITIPVGIGFNLIGNPYPAGMTLGDISMAGLSDQDKVFLWDGVSYVDYTYFAGFGWYDSFFVLSDHVPVAVGQGFWLLSTASGNLIFNKPY